MEENKEVVETIEAVEKKKYILSKPKAPDVFLMTSIIGKIGVNKFKSVMQSEDIKNIITNMKGKKNVTVDDIKLTTGLEIFVELAQIICEGMPKCENDIYKILSNTSNLSLEEVKELEAVPFLEMLIDFFKENGDFIKAASKLLK